MKINAIGKENGDKEEDVDGITMEMGTESVDGRKCSRNSKNKITLKNQNNSSRKCQI